jgi:hypothetical protein
MSPFFDSGKDATGWIHLVVTLATPFDGATLHTLVGRLVADVIRDVLFFFLSQIGSNPIYNLKLDHLGLTRKNGESFEVFLGRILSSRIFDPDFEDSIEYDVSPKAQYEFNKSGPQTFPGTHYLAYSTHQTKAKPSDCGRDFVSNDSMEWLLVKFGNAIGDLTNAKLEGGKCVEDAVFNACDPTFPVHGPWNDRGYKGWCADGSWEENDGFISRRSTTGPTFGYSWDVTRPKALGLQPFRRNGCKSRKSWNQLTPNQWYFVDIGVDHIQIVGFHFQPNIEDVNRVYTH